MQTILLFIFFLCFSFISFTRLQLGLFFLFLFLPSYLIEFNLGPVPTTMLEVMLAVITLSWLTKKRLQILNWIQKVYSKHFYFTIAIILFVVAATISIFNGIDPLGALGEWKSFYIEPIILLTILTTTIKTKQQLKNILFTLVISGFATSILAIYQHFTGAWVPYSFWENNNSYRVTAWYGFPNAVGHFLVPVIIISIYLIYDYFKWGSESIKEKLKSFITDWFSIFKKEKKKKYKKIKSLFEVTLSLLTVPAALLGIVFAKSTGALVGVIGGLGVLVLFTKFRWWAVGIGIIGLVSIFMLPKENVIKQELLLQNRTGQLRINMWSQTYRFLQDNPIFGSGISAYKEKIIPYRENPNIETFHHPHNLWLTIWVNLGLLGFIAFNLILVWFYKEAFLDEDYDKIRENQELTLLSVSIFTTFLIMGLVDSPNIKNDLALLFWFPIGIIFIKNQLKQRGFN